MKRYSALFIFTTWIPLLIVSILIVSCKMKKSYTVVVSSEYQPGSRFNGVTDNTKSIKAENDSLAYSEGASSFCTSMFVYDMDGGVMDYAKPADFKVTNKEGVDIRYVLEPETVQHIEKHWNDEYLANRNRNILRGKKILLDKGRISRGEYAAFERELGTAPEK